MSFLKSIIYLLGITPITWIIPLQAFYIKASKNLGYLPHYGNPDPGTLLYSKDYNYYIDIGFNIWGYSLIVWIIISVILIISSKRKTFYKSILISFLFHLFGYANLFLESFAWYID